jgi:hypothetical protein
MYSLIPLGMIFFLLSGCEIGIETFNVGKIDSANKSITVPSEGVVIYDIKKALKSDGWKVKTGEASLNEFGIKSKIKLDTNSTVEYDTTYRMHMYSNEDHGGGINSFTFTIVNNSSNDEVVTIYGKNTVYAKHEPKHIVESFMSSLRNLEQ